MVSHVVMPGGGRAHLQELADVVEDTPAPQHRFDNAAEVVILHFTAVALSQARLYTLFLLRRSVAGGGVIKGGQGGGGFVYGGWEGRGHRRNLTESCRMHNM